MATKPRRGSHGCAAIGCPKIIPLGWLMCRPHWFMVPMEIRRRVWVGYARGMDAEYDVAVKAAVDAVAEKESKRV